MTAGSSSTTLFDDTRQWGCKAPTATRSHFRRQSPEVCNPLVHRSGGTSVALDDGQLIFADTEDLTIDPGFHRSAPNPNPDPDSAVRTPGRHRGE
ncbi:MAG: hypothetical protein EOP32_32560 [Rhodococcus sp. (in: high G+C Gram-positive bacteria)]|nr:MAG: hypothetical protein EOP32_32560 [Rhodococcus sp. (in: high G+C Gram-positive bacteria)]